MAKRAKGSVTAVERTIVELFFKTVGIEAGFYRGSEREFAAGWESEPLYQSNLETVRRLLAAGMPAEDLKAQITHRYREGARERLLAAIVGPPKAALADGDDLRADDPHPVHPALFIRRAPGYAVTELGLLPVSPGSVEPKATFTVKELVDQYYRRVKTGDTLRRRAAAAGQWRWLLEQATLSELLFAIDLAAESGEDVAPLALTRFLPQAAQEVKLRRARRAP